MKPLDEAIYSHNTVDLQMHLPIEVLPRMKKLRSESPSDFFEFLENKKEHLNLFSEDMNGW